MSTFNSKNNFQKKFNSLRHAAFKRKIREIARLYPSSGSSMQGWSQLDSDPSGFMRERAQERFASHLVNGCTASEIPGEFNEDGTQKRNCLNQACGGRTKPLDWSSLAPEDARRVAELAGITVSRSNSKIHHPGDGCSEGHHDLGLIGNAPTLADYACLQLNVPGSSKPISMMELLGNHGSMQIGTDQNGEAIYPGHYMTDKRTGQKKLESAFMGISDAAFSAKAGMVNLINKGVTDLRPYFDVGKRIAQRVYHTKRKEFDKNDPDGEQFTGRMQDAPSTDPLHVIVDGTLKNIRNTLGDHGIIAEDKHSRRLWDMLKTVKTVQTFNPHHVIDEQLNPLNHVVDVQHHDEAATGLGGRVPELQKAYFAAYPQDIPDIGSMAEAGNVAKRDPHSAFYRSDMFPSFINRLVRDHQERDNPTRLDSPIPFQAEYSPQSDPYLLEAINKDPERFRIGE
jgi:hypothetical protein